MRNERLVVSRERLLDEVWGYDPMAATNTIDVFISNLRRKLEAGEREPAPAHQTRRRLRAEGLRRVDCAPGNWPVRWRLAAVSAGLTLAILVLFGAIVGNLAAQRVRDDFNREMKGAVADPRLAGADRRHDHQHADRPRARPRRLRQPQRRLGADLRLRAANSSTPAPTRPTSARPSPASATSARCGSSPPPCAAARAAGSPATSSTAATSSTSTRPIDRLWLVHRRRRAGRDPARQPRRASRSPAGRCARSPR